MDLSWPQRVHLLATVRGLYLRYRLRHSITSTQTGHRLEDMGDARICFVNFELGLCLKACLLACAGGPLLGRPELTWVIFCSTLVFESHIMSEVSIMTADENTVVAAIQALCNPSTDPAIRSQVTEWLEHFQNTIAAWKVAMDLLTSQRHEAVLIFAAQTLKHKLIHDFAQLDEATTVRLRQHIWSLIGPASPFLQHHQFRPVLTQLQLALAALAVQANESLWPDPVGDALGTLRSQPAVLVVVEQQNLYTSIINFLAMIPEQLANTQIHLPTDYYRSQRDRLLRGDRLNELLVLLSDQLGSSNASNTTAIWACLLSWVRYSSSNGGTPLDSTNILRAAFAHVQSSLGNGDEDGLDTASEMVCELYYREHQSGQDPSAAWMQSMLDGLHGTFSLFPLLKISGSANAEDEQDEQTDLVRHIAPLFVEAGEAFMSYLVGPYSGALEMIASAVLALSQSFDRSIVEDTLVFWAALASQLLNDQGMEESFRPLFQQVFMALLVRHLVQPADPSSVTAEEMDAFRDFRHVVGDALKDCCRVSGSTEAVLLIAQIILTDHQLAAEPWPKIEAALFALRTISSVVDRRESEALPVLYPAILKIGHHPKLVYAVVLVIGCYADWLRYHAEWIQPSLEYVLAALGHDETRAAAALSLKHMAESVANMMGRYATALTEQVYPQTLDMLRTGHISDRVLCDVTEAIARILSLDRSSPSALDAIIAPWRDILGSRPDLGKLSLALDQFVCITEAVMTEARDATDHGHPPLPAAQYLANYFSSQIWPLIETLACTMVPPAPSVISLSLCSLVEAGLSVPEDRLLSLLDRLVIHCQQSMRVLRAELIRTTTPGGSKAFPSARLVQSIHAALSASTQSVERHGVELIVLMTTAVDYLDGIASDPSLIVPTLGITRTILATTTASTSDLFQSLVFILHLLAVMDSQEAAVSSSSASLVSLGSAEIDGALWANVETILAGLVQFYPPTVIGDVASILRRYRRGTGDLGMLFGQVLAALPAGYFIDRERQVLQDQFNQALVAPRARDLKDFLLQFSQTCRRRLK